MQFQAQLARAALRAERGLRTSPAVAGYDRLTWHSCVRYREGWSQYCLDGGIGGGVQLGVLQGLDRGGAHVRACRNRASPCVRRPAPCLAVRPRMPGRTPPSPSAGPLGPAPSAAPDGTPRQNPLSQGPPAPVPPSPQTRCGSTGTSRRAGRAGSASRRGRARRGRRRGAGRAAEPFHRAARDGRCFCKGVRGRRGLCTVRVALVRLGTRPPRLTSHAQTNPAASSRAQRGRSSSHGSCAAHTAGF